MKRFLLFVICYLSTWTANAQEGTWYGKLDIQGTILPVVFHFSDDGCTLDSPAQGAKGIRAERISEGNHVKVAVPSIGVTYEGDVDGNKITGQFKQGGYSFPLTLTVDVPSVKRPQTPVGPFDYSTEEVSFNRDNYTLVGTLTLPKDYSSKTPVVILLTGSGVQNRDEEIFEHKPFAVIADALAHKGIASLRYDDRGYNVSNVSLENITIGDYKKDALAGIEFLRDKFSKVGLIGHSEGGTIGLMLASEGKIDFVVSMAGMVVSGKETLLYQNRLLLETLNLPEDKLDRYISTIGNVLDCVSEGKPETIDLSTVPQEFVSDIVKLKENCSAPYIRDFITIDVRKSLSKIHCPVLALNGKLDTQVECKTNLDALAKHMNNTKCDIAAFDNLNHLFQHCKTGSVMEYQQIEETISLEVLQKIATWINSLY